MEDPVTMQTSDIAIRTNQKFRKFILSDNVNLSCL